MRLGCRHEPKRLGSPIPKRLGCQKIPMRLGCSKIKRGDFPQKYRAFFPFTF